MLVTPAFRRGRPPRKQFEASETPLSNGLNFLAPGSPFLSPAERSQLLTVCLRAPAVPVLSQEERLNQPERVIAELFKRTARANSYESMVTLRAIRVFARGT